MCNNEKRPCDIPPPQLPLTAVLQELHTGDWGSLQRSSFQSSILPPLLTQLWSLRHTSSLWLAYRLARSAAIKVRGQPSLLPLPAQLSLSICLCRASMSWLDLFSSCCRTRSPWPSFTTGCVPCTSSPPPSCTSPPLTPHTPLLTPHNSSLHSMKRLLSFPRQPYWLRWVRCVRSVSG